MEFVLNKSILEDNIKKFMWYGSIYYPLKANSNKLLLLALKQLNIKYLMNRPEHLNTLADLGVQPSTVTQTNTLMQLEDLIKLYNNGIKSFVVDSPELLAQLVKATKAEDLEITIKISSSLVSNIQTNTGANKQEIHEIVKIVNKYMYKYGFSVYINKRDRHKYSYNEYIRLLVDTARSYNASYISIGGLDDSEDCNVSLRKWSNIAMSNGLEVRVEPGEYLLKDAITMSSKIINIRRGPCTSITIEGSCYDIYYDFVALNRQLRVNKIGNEAVRNEPFSGYERIHIFGDSGDSNDYLGSVYMNNKKQVEVGQEVTIADTGYYMGRQ